MSVIPEVQSIDEQIAALQEQKKQLLNEKRKEALRQAQSLVMAFGLTAQELGLVAGAKAASGTAKKNKPPAKYQNPNDPAETWHGGRGPRPAWIKAFLDNGGVLESIRIK